MAKKESQKFSQPNRISDVDAEVRKAVDLEEAVARERNRRRKERNRRRKAQLQRTAEKEDSQVGSGLSEVRYVLAGLLIVTIAIFGYQAYETNRKQEEARIERQAEKTRTVQAMSMWLSRNACLASEFEQRWQAWYAENPETQTVKVWSSRSRKYVDITNTIDAPKTLGDVSRSGTFPPREEGAEIEWRVSRDHFVGLISPIRIECGDQFAPPEGWDHLDIEESLLHSKIRTFDLAPENMSICETDDYFGKFSWQDPFAMLSKESRCNFQLIP
jgi:hypothetical protein